MSRKVTLELKVRMVMTIDEGRPEKKT